MFFTGSLLYPFKVLLPRTHVQQWQGVAFIALYHFPPDFLNVFFFPILTSMDHLKMPASVGEKGRELEFCVADAVMQSEGAFIAFSDT